MRDRSCSESALRRVLLFATLAGLFSSLSVAAAEKRRFDIAAGEAARTLNEFSRQAELQIYFDADAVRRFMTNAVAGEFEAADALSTMLGGTGLAFEFVNERTIAVMLLREERSSAEMLVPYSIMDGDAPDDWITDTTALARHRASQRTQTEAAGPNGQEGGSPRDASQKNFEQVTVTGSRLKRPAEEGMAPVTTFDRKAIEQLGVTTVADVLNYLPQQSFWNSEQQTVGTRTVQLRGLALGTTLVLVNGRRTITSALTSPSNTFDLNSIPLSAVDRVEVLSGSASAVYGTDAVGGVVNIILKSEIEEPMVDLYYGLADGGADERRGSLSFGHAGPRLKASITLDAFKRDLLLGEHRDRMSDQDFRRFGGSDFRVPQANPGNVCSVTGANLPGLPAPCAAVPEGSTGTPTAAAFLPTAGQTRLESISRFRGAVPETARYSGVATLAFDFTDYLSAFGEFTYSDIDTTTVGPVNVLTNRTVPSSNPFNPFGVPVRVNYRFAGVAAQTSLSESELFRGVAGLKGKWGTWDWELSLLDTHATGRPQTVNQVSTPRVNAALAATDPNQALNVFSDGPAGSPELLASLIVVPSPGDHSSDGLQGTAFARGPLFTGPAGPVGVVVGAESRNEELDFNLPGFGVSADRDSSAAFGELRVPLVDAAMRVPVAQEITLTLAGRYDRYSDFGSTFNPEYGAEWRPFARLLARASYGTSFRAPSLFLLHQPSFSFPVVIADPQRSNEVTSITQSIGGNPDLDAEESKSWSIGLVWMVGELARIRASADYWRIEQDSRLQDLSASIILTNESLFSNRVRRAPPTAADIAAGRPGQLLSIDSTTINFGELETSGIDFQITGPLETAVGDFTPTLTATWVRKYEASDVPNAPTVGRAGVASIQGTIPRWRVTAGLAWNRTGIELLTTARYISSYDDVNLANVRTGRAVEPPVIVDLQGSIELSEFFGATSAWLDGMTLRVGVVNLFDKEPDFSEVRGSSGFDPSQADLRQRFSYISVSKRF